MKMTSSCVTMNCKSCTLIPDIVPAREIGHYNSSKG